MRVVQDEETKKETAQRNERAMLSIKNEFMTQVEALNAIQTQFNKGKRVIQKGMSMFVDEKGAMLASSTIALNGVAFVAEVALDLWNQWRDFNVEMEEFSETMRRYGVGDVSNQTDLRRNIFTGIVVGKRRY